MSIVIQQIIHFFAIVVVCNFTTLQSKSVLRPSQHRRNTNVLHLNLRSGTRRLGISESLSNSVLRESLATCPIRQVVEQTVVNVTAWGYETFANVTFDIPLLVPLSLFIVESIQDNNVYVESYCNTVIVPNLKLGSIHSFRVKIKNPIATSPWSDISNIITADSRPSHPRNGEYFFDMDGSLQISWQAPVHRSNIVTAYKIHSDAWNDIRDITSIDGTFSQTFLSKFDNILSTIGEIDKMQVNITAINIAGESSPLVINIYDMNMT